MNLSSLTSGVKSVQRGVTSPSGTVVSWTITISAVTTGKYDFTFGNIGQLSFCTSAGILSSISISNTSIVITLTGSANLPAYFGYSSGGGIPWQLIEYN